MALFGKNDGGVMDAIRCDEQDYLIWKWHPKGSSSAASQRANTIRWGSSLRVRDGSVAAFVHAGPEGGSQDFIEGPYDGIVKTDNLPVLAALVGKFYDGGSYFPAEVYFINLAELIQIKFGVPYFDVYDAEFSKYSVPVAVRGSVNFRIADYRRFIKLHRLDSFDMGRFKNEIKSTVVRYVKETVINLPNADGIPVVQIERHLAEVNARVEARLVDVIRETYGVSVSRIDISDIEIDKTSDGYKKMIAMSQNRANMFVQGAQTLFSDIGAHRKGAKRVAQTNDQEGKPIEPVIDLGEVGKNVGDAIGGAADAIGGFLGGLGQKKEAAPPPVPIAKYYVVQDEAQAGPFGMSELAALVAEGRLDANTLVWKDGMSDWEPAGSVDELAGILEP
ncbi:MAG: SPFH domain-containing protein [Eggerthellaceae bacterium]|nr:SPFH domain-containing protein [Eggerthellaceae bacterium]